MAIAASIIIAAVVLVTCAELVQREGGSSGNSTGVVPQRSMGAIRLAVTAVSPTSSATGGQYGIGGDWPRMYVPAGILGEPQQDTATATRPIVPVLAVDDASGAYLDGDIRAEFERGYREAGGDAALLEHFVSVVIPCESGWNPNAVSDGGHLGLAQFAPDSWAKAGGGDWRSAYQQGGNVARWAAMTTPSEQWSCW